MTMSAYTIEPIHETDQIPIEYPNHWANRTMLLWQHRRMLARVTAISLVVSLGIAFVIPKEYTATTSIMPPEQQGGWRTGAGPRWAVAAVAAAAAVLERWEALQEACWESARARPSSSAC